MNEQTKEILQGVKQDLKQADPMIADAEEILSVMKDANEPGWQEYEMKIRQAKQRAQSLNNAIQRKGIS